MRNDGSQFGVVAESRLSRGWNDGCGRYSEGELEYREYRRSQVIIELKCKNDPEANGCIPQKGEGGWRAIGIIATTRLPKSNLSRNQIRIALWLPIIAQRRNMVVVSGAKAKQALGIERHTSSQILGSLTKHGLIRRKTRGVFIVNPHFAWNGSDVEHKLAVETWDTIAAAQS